MRRSLKAGRLVHLDAPTSVADKLVVKRVGRLDLDLCRRCGIEVLTVDDGSIAEAMRLLLKRANLLAEGAGDAPLAALLAHRERFAGQRVALVITGGNLTEAALRQAFGQG